MNIKASVKKYFCETPNSELFWSGVMIIGQIMLAFFSWEAAVTVNFIIGIMGLIGAIDNGEKVYIGFFWSIPVLFIAAIALTIIGIGKGFEKFNNWIDSLLALFSRI